MTHILVIGTKASVRTLSSTGPGEEGTCQPKQQTERGNSPSCSQLLSSLVITDIFMPIKRA